MLLLNFLPNKILHPSNFDLCITCGQRDQIVCIHVILIILYVQAAKLHACSHAGEVRDSLQEKKDCTTGVLRKLHCGVPWSLCHSSILKLALTMTAFLPFGSLFILVIYLRCFYSMHTTRERSVDCSVCVREICRLVCVCQRERERSIDCSTHSEQKKHHEYLQTRTTLCFAFRCQRRDQRPE